MAADRARARRGEARRARPVQRRDRTRDRHFAGDREDPRPQHLREKRHPQPRRIPGSRSSVAVSRWSALVLLAIALLLGMSLWFGVSAAAPQVAREWKLSESTTAWLTLAVQLGFVFGTLASALLNLPDVIRARHLCALCAFAGAAVNAVLAWTVHSTAPAIALRFATGMFLAGVYPPAMKIIATWFRMGRGFALGVLIGALTLGKASPYLVNAVGSSNWRVNVTFTSLSAVAGGLIVLLLRDGPYALPNQPFAFSQ